MNQALDRLKSLPIIGSYVGASQKEALGIAKEQAKAAFRNYKKLVTSREAQLAAATLYFSARSAKDLAIAVTDRAIAATDTVVKAVAVLGALTGAADVVLPKGSEGQEIAEHAVTTGVKISDAVISGVAERLQRSFPGLKLKLNDKNHG